MTQLLAEEGHLQVRLADLLSLQDAQIPAGAFAMRPLDEVHIQQLIDSQQARWPEIEVARCERGYIVVDGYHRWEAAKRRGAAMMNVTCRAYADEHALIEAAFQANLAHGLKASLQTRGDYAYWLHISLPDLFQEEIAARTGLTQGAVSKAIAKRSEDARRLQEEEDQEPLNGWQTQRRAIKRFTKGARRFLSEVEELEDAEVVALLTDDLNADDRAKLARLLRLLGGDQPEASPEPLRLRQFQTVDHQWNG